MSDDPKFDNDSETYIDRFLRPVQKAPPPIDRSPETLKAQREAREAHRQKRRAALYAFGRRGQ